MFIADGLRLGHVILDNVAGRSYCDARFEHAVAGAGASSIQGGHSEFTIGCRKKGFEEGDRCKPEQPSIQLPLNVVLRNATTIRQVQCTSQEQAAVKASEDGC